MNRKRRQKERYSRAAAPHPLLLSGFLLIFCLLLIPEAETYGAYRTKSEGADSARVAAFDVEITTPVPVSDNAVLDLNDPDDMVVYRFDVVNHSEVPIYYRLYAENVPEGFRAVFSEGEGELEAVTGRKTARLVLQRTEGNPDGFLLQNMEIKAEVRQVEALGGR